MIVRSIQSINGSFPASVKAPAALTAAQAVAILKDRRNAKLTITDTAENISKNFDFLSANKQNIQVSPFLGSNSKLQISYQQYLAINSDDSFLPSSYKVGITSATGQESLSLLSDKKITEINVTDSSLAFIEAARLLGKAEQVNYFNKVKEIRFTDNQKNVKLQALDLSLKPLLDAKLKGSSITVTGSIVEINKISNLKRLGAVEIVDTNQNISTQFNTIQSLKNNIVGISSSDPQTVLAISAEQAKSNKNLLQTIKSGFELKLTQASAKDAATFAKDSRITSINVVDTVSNLTRNLSRINSENSKVASVTVSDQSKKISENLATIFKIKNAELKIIQTDAKNPIEISADALSMNRYLVTKSFEENSLKLKDTAENISKNLNNLNSVETQIKEISVSDNKPITTSFAKIESLLGKFQTPTKIDLIGDVKNLGPKIGSVNLNYEKANIIRQTSSPINARKPRTIDPIELTAGQLSSINSPISIASPRNSAVVKDTAANVSANINTIINLNNQIQKITITDNQPIAATYAQLGQIMSKFGESQTFIANDTAANVAANLSAITAMGNKVAQINLTDNAQITATYADISPLIGKISTQQSINIADTSSNITAHLDTISNFTNLIKKVTVTDNQTITATCSELFQIASKCEPAQLYIVADTAVNISTNLGSIKALANNIDRIVLTDNGLISTSYAEIAEIAKKFERLPIFNLVDSVENIYTNIYGLFDLIDNHDNIASVNLTNNDKIFDTWNYPPMYPVIKLVDKISGDINIVRARVWQSKDLYDLENVKTISLSEYPQNIPLFFSDLNESLPKITDIKSLDAFFPLVAPIDEYKKFQGLINLITGDFSISVLNSSIEEAIRLSPPNSAKFAWIQISDSATNLDANLSNLADPLIWYSYAIRGTYDELSSLSKNNFSKLNGNVQEITITDESSAITIPDLNFLNSNFTNYANWPIGAWYATNGTVSFSSTNDAQKQYMTLQVGANGEPVSVAYKMSKGITTGNYVLNFEALNTDSNDFLLGVTGANGINIISDQNWKQYSVPIFLWSSDTTFGLYSNISTIQNSNNSKLFISNISLSKI